MGFGRGKGFSPPSVSPFPEGYTLQAEKDLTDYRWTHWLRYYLSGKTYLQAHDAAEATNVLQSSNRFCAQGKADTNKYYIERKPLYFDTSAIPSGAIITGVTLYQYIQFVAGREKDLHLLDAPDLNDPPVVADYGYILGLTSSIGILTTANQTSARRCTFEINQAGFDSIVKGGTTKWAMRTIDDINTIEPSVTVEGIYLSAEPSHLLIRYYTED